MRKYIILFFLLKTLKETYKLIMKPSSIMFLLEYLLCPEGTNQVLGRVIYIAKLVLAFIFKIGLEVSTPKIS
jgi:hypothetical protein